jgi:spermidine/putrescine transport system substrate-binding protein
VSFVPDKLVQDGFIPANLASAIVREDDFKTGLPALELSTDAQDAWHSIWLAYKAGN